ncbi:zinc-binding dehydrogenase [Streptomyces sp. NPDC021356]
MTELDELAATGRIEARVSRTHPLSEVRAAFTHLEHDHPLGKVVLLP